MGGVRDPRRAARAGALRQGPARGRVDVRRRAVLARARGGALPRRATWCRSAARSSSRAASSATGPTPARTAGSRSARSSRSSGRRGAAGVGREDLIEKQFEAPGSDAHAEVERIFLERTREEWREFASHHDCCLEPVLDLDEALDSELVRAREMVVEVDQPGTDGVQPARRAGQALAHAGRAGRPGPGAGRAHRARCSPALGYERGRDRGAGGGRRGGRPRRGRRSRELHGVSARTGS